MRPIYFVLMTLLSSAVYAGCENSTMSVHTSRQTPIKVYVDGSTGTNPATQTVIVTGISPGRHQLKVVEVYTHENGYKERHTVYTGTINVHPSIYMTARVDEGRGVSMHEDHMDCQGNVQGQGGTQPNSGEYKSPDGNATMNESQMPDIRGNAQRAAPQNGTPAQNGTAAISDADFDQMKNAIAAQKYESKKMDTLKTLVGGHNFNTMQVSDLMGLFAFESNKLDVAKMLYAYTVDIQNYKRLESNFNFDARKQEFEKFLVGK
jgi:hypothetical protein